MRMSRFLSEFREVLAKGDDLPSLPAVVFELYAALDDELVCSNEIAAIIKRDPALATRLLHLANSAAFNCGTPVGQVDGAVLLLGLRQVRALCMALGVANMFSGRGGGLIGRSFWVHSAGVALVARELARCLRYNDVPREELYVAGLLHDVGLLILDQNYPKKLMDAFALAEDCESPLWMGENIALATDHGEIGGLLLGRWGLPPSIVSMVTAHHNPDLAPEKYRNACWLIYAAEILCGGLGPGLEIERLGEEQALSFLQEIQSAGYDADGLVEELGDASQEFASALV